MTKKFLKGKLISIHPSSVYKNRAVDQSIVICLENNHEIELFDGDCIAHKSMIGEIVKVRFSVFYIDEVSLLKDPSFLGIHKIIKDFDEGYSPPYTPLVLSAKVDKINKKKKLIYVDAGFYYIKIFDDRWVHKLGINDCINFKTGRLDLDEIKDVT